MDVRLACQQYRLLSWGGIIQPPPAMVKSIEQFVVGTYAKQFLKQFQYDMESREKSLKEQAQDFTNNEKTDINVIRHILESKAAERENAGVMLLTLSKAFVEFDFAGWKCPYGDPKVVQAMLEAEDLLGIWVEVRFGESVGNHKALWYGSQWTFKIFLPLPECPTIGEYKIEVLNLDRLVIDIRDTVEHELIHMVQQIGPHIKNMPKDIAGMPPRKVRAPEYNPAGWQREDPNYKGTRREYVLHDSEFYTNLHDALNEYKRFSQLVPEGLQDEFLRVFVGAQERIKNIHRYPKSLRSILRPNHFLLALRWYDEPRWKEAVKRFIGSI